MSHYNDDDDLDIGDLITGDPREQDFGDSLDLFRQAQNMASRAGVKIPGGVSQAIQRFVPAAHSIGKSPVVGRAVAAVRARVKPLARPPARSGITVLPASAAGSVHALIAPHLQTIQRQLAQSALRRQATNEHKKLNADAAFKAEVRTRLNRIMAKLGDAYYSDRSRAIFDPSGGRR